MNSPVTQIKERLSIEEVVSSYIKIEHAGTNLKARCPFHNEKTPSFFLSPTRGTYYCFGCGAKGDIFSFVQEFEGLDFRGALKLLADKAGVALEHYNKEKESEKEKLYRAMEEATLFFRSCLAENQLAQTYLKDRGITTDTIEKFRIGFAPDAWDSLFSFLKAKNFDTKILESAGLVKMGDKGFYDRFRSRIIFPINDSSGRVIAFSGRIFGDKEKVKDTAKYLNSPETPLFNKSLVLYGMDHAKESIRKNNFSILVEGQMDLVLSHQSGFKNTVATSGTALSDNLTSKEEAISNLGLVRRLSTNIVLAFDADDAGFKAIAKAGKIGLYLGMDVKVAEIPEGLDPADLIAKSGVDAWRTSIKNSKHIIDFILDRILESNKEDIRKVGRMIKGELLGYVNILPSSIEKSHFLKKISEASEIPEYALEEDLKKLAEESSKEKKELAELEELTIKSVRKDHIERKVFGILFWQESLQDRKVQVDELKNKLQNIFQDNFQNVLEHFGKEKDDLIFEAEVFYTNHIDLTKDLKELLENLSEEFLKTELAKKMRELKVAEGEGDMDKSEELLKECQIINQKIEEIKMGRVKN